MSGGIQDWANQSQISKAGRNQSCIQLYILLEKSLLPIKIHTLSKVTFAGWQTALAAPCTWQIPAVVQAPVLATLTHSVWNTRRVLTALPGRGSHLFVHWDLDVGMSRHHHRLHYTHGTRCQKYNKRLEYV